MKKELIKSRDGLNLFFRPKGTLVERLYREEIGFFFVEKKIQKEQKDDVWVVQYQGYPEKDSGYTENVFKYYEDALDYFNKLGEGL